MTHSCSFTLVALIKAARAEPLMKHRSDTVEHGLTLLTHLLQAQINTAKPAVFDLKTTECARSSSGCCSDKGLRCVMVLEGACGVLQ